MNSEHTLVGVAPPGIRPSSNIKAAPVAYRAMAENAIGFRMSPPMSRADAEKIAAAWGRQGWRNAQAFPIEEVK